MFGIELQNSYTRKLKKYIAHVLTGIEKACKSAIKNGNKTVTYTIVDTVFGDYYKFFANDTLAQSELREELIEFCKTHQLVYTAKNHPYTYRMEITFQPASVIED